MPLPYMRWLLSGVWVSLALCTFTFADPSSARSWLYLLMASVIPPVIMMRLRSEGSSTTVARIAHATGGRL